MALTPRAIYRFSRNIIMASLISVLRPLFFSSWTWTEVSAQPEKGPRRAESISSDSDDQQAEPDPDSPGVLAQRLLSGTRQQCRAVLGQVWLYGDLAQREAHSAEQCCEMCDAQEGCVKWSFGFAGKLKNKCLLREDDAYGQPNPEVISGQGTFARERRASEEEEAKEEL